MRGDEGNRWCRCCHARARACRGGAAGRADRLRPGGATCRTSGRGYDVNNSGVALEPGFGAAYRRKNLRFGVEIATPVAIHMEKQGDNYEDGYFGADIQPSASVGATF